MDTIAASCRESTRRRYRSHIRKWEAFCSRSRITYDAVTITDVLEFLAGLHHDEHLSYSAINSARSALSFYLNIEVGSNRLVSRLMRGIFNTNPPTPRYNITWDVRDVLTLLRTWSPMEGLQLDKLTMKLVMLLALTSAQRVQTLHKLRVDRMMSTPTEVVFFVDELLKQHRPGCTGLQLKFPAYPADARLCLASHIRYYVKVTASIRGMERYLLVTHKRPHHRVTTQTISRWLRVVLGKSGIDTNVFKSHSTRAASTSAARVMEVPMDHILATAGWANEAVFQRFYNRPVAAPLQFAEAVLNAGQERGDVPE